MNTLQKNGQQMNSKECSAITPNQLMVSSLLAEDYVDYYVFMMKIKPTLRVHC